jgi:hypothetical protein
LILPVVGAIEKYPTFSPHVIVNLWVSPGSSSVYKYPGSTNFFNYYVGINTAVNTVIGSVVATDGDTGTFGMNF